MRKKEKMEKEKTMEKKKQMKMEKLTVIREAQSTRHPGERGR